MLKFLTSVGNTGQKEIGGNVYAEMLSLRTLNQLVSQIKNR
jgi:hypothetical protein